VGALGRGARLSIGEPGCQLRFVTHAL
jgi:hypothetical protein